MNKILLQSEDKKIILIKEIESLFHGKVTIHFAHGNPKKVEVNKVEDIPFEVLKVAQQRLDNSSVPTKGRILK